MKRLIGALVVLCFFAAPAMAQQWSTYKSPDGRFQFEMPAPYTASPPKVEKGTDKFIGSTFTEFVGESPDGSFFQVFVKEFDKQDSTPPARQLVDAQAVIQTDVPGFVPLRESIVNQGSWAGRAFAFRTVEEGVVSIVQARLFVAGRRLYGAIAVTSSELAGDTTVSRFLASLKILRE